MFLERIAKQVVQCHHARMNAYSEDLRKKIVEALERGTTKSEAARTFGVSRSSVKRYAKLAEEGRSLSPPRSAPAPSPRWTSVPGDCLKRTSRSAPRPPSPSVARS